MNNFRSFSYSKSIRPDVCEVNFHTSIVILQVPEHEPLIHPKIETFMTTYAYSITLTDSELIALRAALNYYQNRCLGELTEGPCAPYWAHNEAIKDIQKK